jgi:hypothetical protein
MHRPLPPEIEVGDDSPERVRYRLPQRPPQLIGLTVFWCGAVLAALTIVGWAMFDLALSVNLIGNLVAAFLIGGALLFGRGHVEVEVAGGWLRRTNCLGPLRLTASRPAARIRRFLLDDRWAPSHPAGWDDTTCLFAEIESGTRLLVAGGYPRNWLLALADELAVRCAASA